MYNGPDDCSGNNANRNISVTRAAAAKPDPAVPCPIISTAEKLEGSITLRAFMSESIADRGSVVPFYFSPTIGGSDINGNAMLASYPDYRFRGPNLLLFRGPSNTRSANFPSVDSSPLTKARSGCAATTSASTISVIHFSVGLTVRAGDCLSSICSSPGEAMKAITPPSPSVRPSSEARPGHRSFSKR